MSHIFISYSKKNRAYARSLADHLLSLGFDIWIDDRIDYGSDWEEEIFKAIDACAAFIIIMTPESYTSKWVRREMQHAENHNKPPFPLLLAGESFPRYNITQYVDVSDNTFPSNDFVKLLARACPPKSHHGEDVTTIPVTDEATDGANFPTLDTATFPAAPMPKVAPIPVPDAEAPTLVVNAPQPPSLLARAAPIFSALKQLIRGSKLRIPTTIPSLRSRNSRLAFAAVIVLILAGFVVLRGLLQPFDTNQIAFTSDRNGNKEIYVMNSNGDNVRQLTNNSASDGDPSWSPDGSKIVFYSCRTNGCQIHVMDADGKNPQQLTDNKEGQNYNPVWSPDGNQIAFTSKRDGNLEIYVMNANGTNQTNLSNNQAIEYSPTWSPDGKQIAFRSDREGGIAQIYVMNVNGIGQRNLTKNKNSSFTPSWSPDGRQIAFSSNQDDNQDIYVMNADGSDPHKVTQNPAADNSPSWSPDGKQIIFSSSTDGNTEIYSINVDGSNPRKITDDSANDSEPDWRPTVPNPDLVLSVPTVDVAVQAIERAIVTQTQAPIATRVASTNIASTAAAQNSRLGQIAFTSNRNGHSEIYVMDTNGSNVRQLTHDTADQYSPDWSPNGKQITYRVGGDIFVRNADGSNSHNLTNSSTVEYSPHWSPDGNYIAFMSRGDADAEIYVMNADGSNPRNLTNNTTDEYAPDWSRDGKQIAFFTSRDGNYEIYVMNADGTNQHNLTKNQSADDLPAWSPDGKQIAFKSQRDGDGDSEIYVMDADGTNQRNLTKNQSADDSPVWSLDSRQIAFSSLINGKNIIYLMNADGTNQHNLTDNTANDLSPSWRPIAASPDPLIALPTVDVTVQAAVRAIVTQVIQKTQSANRTATAGAKTATAVGTPISTLPPGIRFRKEQSVCVIHATGISPSAGGNWTMRLPVGTSLTVMPDPIADRIEYQGYYYVWPTSGNTNGIIGWVNGNDIADTCN